MRSPLTVRQCGFLGALGGAVFVPYAVTKSGLSSAAVDRGWSTPGTTAADTALGVHLFETVPVLLLLVGLLGYAASRRSAIGPIGALGIGIAVFGFVAVVLTHFGEHTLHAPAVTGLPGEGGVFVYGYLLSWGVIELGQALLGLDVLRVDGRVTPPAGALVIVLPLAGVVGLAAVATGAFTLAGVHRLLQALLGVTVGRWLWNDRVEATTTDAPVQS